jgi:hypothetical protein
MRLEDTTDEFCLKARVKWRARLAEVLTLQGQLDAARNELSVNFAELSAHTATAASSPSLRWKRSPLLGHTTRRHCRLLCELARRTQNERTQFLDSAEDLYNQNLARITRFPREGVLLLLDRVDILILRNSLSEAEALLDRLPQSLVASLGSFASHMDVDINHARLLLNLVEERRKPNHEMLSGDASLLERAKDSLIRVLRLSQASGLPMFRALAEVEAARWLQLYDRTSESFDGRSFDDLSARGQQTLKAIGYRLHLPPAQI